jgi:hypothetical protein
VDVARQRRNLLGQLLVLPRQVGVRLEQLAQRVRLALDRRHPPLRVLRNLLAVPLVPLVVRLSRSAWRVSASRISGAA